MLFNQIVLSSLPLPSSLISNLSYIVSSNLISSSLFLSYLILSCLVLFCSILSQSLLSCPFLSFLLSNSFSLIPVQSCSLLFCPYLRFFLFYLTSLCPVPFFSVLCFFLLTDPHYLLKLTSICFLHSSSFTFPFRSSLFLFSSHLIYSISSLRFSYLHSPPLFNPLLLSLILFSPLFHPLLFSILFSSSSSLYYSFPSLFFLAIILSLLTYPPHNFSIRIHPLYSLPSSLCNSSLLPLLLCPIVYSAFTSHGESKSTSEC